MVGVKTPISPKPPLEARRPTPGAGWGEAYPASDSSGPSVLPPEGKKTDHFFSTDGNFPMYGRPFAAIDSANALVASTLGHLSEASPSQDAHPAATSPCFDGSPISLMRQIADCPDRLLRFFNRLKAHRFPVSPLRRATGRMTYGAQGDSALDPSLSEGRREIAVRFGIACMSAFRGWIPPENPLNPHMVASPDDLALLPQYGITTLATVSPEKQLVYQRWEEVGVKDQTIKSTSSATISTPLCLMSRIPLSASVSLGAPREFLGSKLALAPADNFDSIGFGAKIRARPTWPRRYRQEIAFF